MKKFGFLKGAVLFITLMAFVMSACSPRLDIAPILGPAPSHTATRIPSETPTFLPSPSHTASPSPSPTLTATPEPVTFKLGPNDDMFSVALYFGVSLDALKTANPEHNPNALRVGSELIIPITPSPVTASQTPSPTPEGKGDSTFTETLNPKNEDEAYPTYCYRDALAGVYCFSVIENDTNHALENVSLLVTLTDENGKSAQAIATPLLNVVPPHSNLPAASYFPPEWGEDLNVNAELDFELPYAEAESRYLISRISDQTTTMLLNDQAAEISGTVVFENKKANFMALNVLAVAWDENNHVLGMRRWSQVDGGSTSSDVPFSFRVYSMAGPIARVETYVEALKVPDQLTPTPLSP